MNIPSILQKPEGAPDYTFAHGLLGYEPKSVLQVQLACLNKATLRKNSVYDGASDKKCATINPFRSAEESQGVFG